MRTILFFLAALLVNFTAAISQIQTSLSDPFELSEPGYSKVLQFKNGYTHFYYANKDILSVTVYDKAHKQVVTKTSEAKDLQIRRLGSITIAGLYEINNEGVMFIQDVQEETPVLIRIRFNIESGEIKENKVIASMEKYKRGSSFAMAFGNVPMSRFDVEKDQYSDAYAVACIHSLAGDTKKRVRVIHFRGDHSEISNAFFSGTANFKYINFLSMCVDEQKVVIAAYGYNTEAHGGKDSRIILGRLRAGEADFASQLLDYTDDFTSTIGIMRYNPGNKKIQFLTVTYLSTASKLFSTKSVNSYLILMSYIDPEALEVTEKKPIVYGSVGKYMTQKGMPVKAFGGMPQNMVVNKDYTTTIFAEHLVDRAYKRNGYTYNRTDLQNIGVLTLDTKGEEVSGSAVLKNQHATWESFMFGQYARDAGFGNTAWLYMSMDNGPYTSYFYLQGTYNRYILYNDYPENVDKRPNDEPDAVKDEKSTTLVYFDPVLGERKYVFGKPAKGNQVTFANIWSSSFLEATNTYAALVVQRSGRKMEHYIAWLTTN